MSLGPPRVGQAVLHDSRQLRAPTDPILDTFWTKLPVEHWLVDAEGLSFGKRPRWPDLRNGVSHLHIRGRDRDRTIEWSKPFEFFDELRALSVIHAGESEGNRNRIESPHVGARLIDAIQCAMDAHRYRSQRDFPLARDRVN